MQIWLEVDDGGDYALRQVGPILSLRKYVGAHRAMLHFDSDRAYFEERMARHGPGRLVDFGVFSIRKEKFRKLLDKIDDKTPALVTQASKMAAVTQASIEAQKAEQGDRLGMAE